ALDQVLGNKVGIAETLLDLGEAAHLQGDYQAAKDFIKQGLAIARELGVNIEASGFWRKSKGLRSLAIARELGVNIERIARLDLRRGYTTLHQNDLERAKMLFASSQMLCQELGNHGGIAACLAGFAGVAVTTGQAERAARLCGSAEALFNDIGIAIDPVDQ